MISDCKKELHNNITHYRRVLSKLKKIRSACHTTYTVTGIKLAVVNKRYDGFSEWNWDYCGSTDGRLSRLFRIYINSI